MTLGEKVNTIIVSIVFATSDTWKLKVNRMAISSIQESACYIQSKYTIICVFI